MAVRTVVLLELDQVADPVLSLERRHVADVGAAKRVDALVVVAHGEYGARAAVGPAGEQSDPAVLQDVGVLELVDQDVPEPVLIVLAQQLVALQQFVAAQQQFGEVDDTFTLALFVVGRVQLDEAPVVVVVDFDLAGAQRLLLAVIDEVLQVARRILFIVDVERLQQALDRGQLILRIEYLEGLRQRRVAMMRTQHPVAQTVESADPHATRIDRQHS